MLMPSIACDVDNRIPIACVENGSYLQHRLLSISTERQSRNNATEAITYLQSVKECYSSFSGTSNSSASLNETSRDLDLNGEGSESSLAVEVAVAERDEKLSS